MASMIGYVFDNEYKVTPCGKIAYNILTAENGERHKIPFTLPKAYWPCHLDENERMFKDREYSAQYEIIKNLIQNENSWYVYVRHGNIKKLMYIYNYEKTILDFIMFCKKELGNGTVEYNKQNIELYLKYVGAAECTELYPDYASEWMNILKKISCNEQQRL